MDKLSYKVLQFIQSQPTDTTYKSIIKHFGTDAKKSISYLEQQKYIKSEKHIIGVGIDSNPVFSSSGKYTITSIGKEYLESRPWVQFDQWITRIIAIWGAITGTAAIIIELMMHSQ